MHTYSSGAIGLSARLALCLSRDSYPVWKWESGLFARIGSEKLGIDLGILLANQGGVCGQLFDGTVATIWERQDRKQGITRLPEFLFACLFFLRVGARYDTEFRSECLLDTN